MEKKNAIDGYYEFRKVTDVNCTRLAKMHGHQITCKKGCSSCCVNLSVFPVEFEAIREEMKKDGFDISSVTFDENATCGFLKNDLCQIYKYRPVICRTHGLPIVFLNDDNPSEIFKEVSFCELNFNNFDEDDDEDGGLIFNDENTMDIDELNTAFFKINQQYCKDPQKRIPLKDICGLKR